LDRPHHDYLGPCLGGNGTLTGASANLAVAGIAVAAYFFLRNRGAAGRVAERFGGVQRVLLNKYYVDEGYDYIVTGRRKLGGVRLGAMGLGEACSWFDANVVDGLVNASGWITRAVATLSSWWDKWIIDGIAVNGPAILARMLSYPTRLLEWGLVQWYALVMTAGLLGFVFYYVYH